MLKWYYAQFSLQDMGSNCYLFQKIAIYNDERQINDNITMSAVKIKEISKHIKTAPFFLFLEGQMPLYAFVYFIFFFHATNLLKCVKMIRLFIQYPYILVFKSAYIINPQRCKMPH